MDLGKIKKVPNRIKQDLTIISLAKNWREILSSKINQTPIYKIELRNGIVINSPKQVDLNFLFHEIWVDKFYSPPGYNIKTNDIILDIGGNIGVFALYAVSQAPNVKVISYEPFPENSVFFKKNIAESSAENVKFNNAAVAAQTGERFLEVVDSWVGHRLDENGEISSNSVKVKSISLDDALKDFDRCDLLKMDCEGSEYEIIYSSSPETLKKIKKFVIEYHDLDSEQRNGNNLRSYLESQSFQTDIFRSFEEGDCGVICLQSKY